MLTNSQEEPAILIQPLQSETLINTENKTMDIEETIIQAKPIEEKPHSEINNDPPKKANLFLSSDEGTDQFAPHNFISESEKSWNESKKQPLFVCEEHNLPIKFFCTIHIDYLCEECKKEHLSHVKNLDDFEFDDLKKRFLNLEEKFTKIKNNIIDHQKSLKTIIDNEKNKSDDISLILRKIYHFLSRPIIRPGMNLRRRRSRSLKKTTEKIKEIKEKVDPPAPITKSAPKVKKEVIPKSRLISDEEDKTFIKLLLESHLKKNEGLSLLFRATRDGFKVSDFHQFCDDKPRTLVIIKSNFGNIFGGFANHPWKSSNQGKYVEDPDAFLFSLTYHTKHKQIKNNEFALFLSKNYGPVFGKGYDLCVKDDCNKKANNYSRLGNSYNSPAEMELEDNYSYLGGSDSFSIEEYEVFEIKDLF